LRHLLVEGERSTLDIPGDALLVQRYLTEIFTHIFTNIHESHAKKAMAAYEKTISRMPGLEDWFVDVNPSPA